MAEITPWEVRGEVDYDKLVKKFGVTPLTEELVVKIEKVAGPNLMLRRRIFFSHRDLDVVLSAWERGEKFFLYTGRGPSGKTHLGHIVPYIFTKYLQDGFKANLLFQVTTDEKFMYHEEYTPTRMRKMAVENMLDIIAVGFDPERTYLMDDLLEAQYIYPIAVSFARRVTYSTVRAVFGFTGETNIGMVFFPAVQAVPVFLGTIVFGNPYCLIPAAIDQDPYWRVTRDVAPKLGFNKPAQIHGKFFPGLQRGCKMSSSAPETAIFTTDSEEDVKRKIWNAFTGGRATVEEQRKLGGNPDICPVFDYYVFLFESDDEVLKERKVACRGGSLLCSECKQELAKRVIDFLKKHQRERERARDKLDRYLLGNKVDLKEAVKNYKLLF